MIAILIASATENYNVSQIDTFINQITDTLDKFDKYLIPYSIRDWTKNEQLNTYLSRVHQLFKPENYIQKLQNTQLVILHLYRRCSNLWEFSEITFYSIKYL